MLAKEHKESPQSEQDFLEDVEEPCNLMLYNDDFNTFDFVIECLMKICQHQDIQAEQCAYIVHYTGKCDVKRGAFSKLQSLKNALVEKGLSATIEKA
ncbi:MAG: ATP-dependent Clp protease adaptor ClpS [Bacteroidales bacterium]|jgi:ATP-dependent Clp protease adaptor protein ClpS|nr:ATP-dependent Clp protease adaptor ClpS [Bacteroidales bacterium]NLK81407.1 ATP-dependent Clp protease adaptor ClpS [Bacteroidales bacterium]HPY83047.1 ATP-dependent Clp protease adaptor ClpS [Bacteroidales bacterium]